MIHGLSSTGTYVNHVRLDQNQQRELEDFDEISICNVAHFLFRYPNDRSGDGFFQQYDVQEQLGAGHSADVHRCAERGTGRMYAVKIYRRQIQTKASRMKSLERETGILWSICHPNILRLRETFGERDGIYLVMELSAMGDLFSYIKEYERLSEQSARVIFKQLFHAVDYLHQRGIIHRDIKLENILVMNKYLHVQLADFGMATIVSDESLANSPCGTPSDMAPEMLPEESVDIWSLGVVLHTCLCGFHPFSHRFYSETFPYTPRDQVQFGKFCNPISGYSFSRAATELIESMLNVNPIQRTTIRDCLSHQWTSSFGLPPIHEDC
ncbi:hypothetical protein S40288_10440 [Stachybotrys chartarum IBT 40288]|nr:hypothetical protein S40288_10440 [Stachybotrys chartarum IBT 40288]